MTESPVVVERAASLADRQPRVVLVDACPHCGTVRSAPASCSICGGDTEWRLLEVTPADPYAVSEDAAFITKLPQPIIRELDRLKRKLGVKSRRQLILKAIYDAEDAYDANNQKGAVVAGPQSPMVVQTTGTLQKAPPVQEESPHE